MTKETLADRNPRIQRDSALPVQASKRGSTIPPRFWLRALGVPQALRLFGCFASIAALEAAGRSVDAWAEAEGRALRRTHRRAAAARRLARVLGDLKGPFAKAGQFASLRYDVLEPEVRAAFATLQDRVAPRPFAEVRAVVEAELGAPIGAHFADFDPAPLGAASVAQVHRARLVSGADVAVKVQFPWLAYSLPADLLLARLLLRLVGGGDPSKRRARIFEEFATGLAEELDFAREARVAAEIAANLAGDPQVVVPVIYTEVSTSRILVMSYLPAIPISDRATLERRGVPVRDVLVTLARAYAKQVFVDGLFHADPHPGNLFVIDEPEASVRPRVLFIDFGLSKHLDPTLRREMRLGIHSLLRRDVEEFVGGMERMGMIAPGARDGVRDAVAAIFDRMAGEGRMLAIGGAQVLALKDQAKRLLEETPGLQLPNALLLYAKTMSYLFALGEELAPDIDIMRISVPYLLRFLAERDGG